MHHGQPNTYDPDFKNHHPDITQFAAVNIRVRKNNTLGVQNFEQKSRPKSTKQTYESGSRKHHKLLTST
jgi:hypothetical protein